VKVLDQGAEVGVALAEGDGNLRQPRPLGRREAAMAGDEDEAVAFARANGEGLYDAGAAKAGGKPSSSFSSMWVRALKPFSTSIFAIGTRGVVRSLI
jgi:hypothetical protein